MFIEYPTLYARILSIFGLYVACEPHIVGTFFKVNLTNFGYLPYFFLYTFEDLYVGVTT